MPLKQTKKRRKKRHYHTGIYHSPKCPTAIHYRSGWEKLVCLYLDSQPDILSYMYEAIAIPYISNARTNKIRHYYPDFIVSYKNGPTIIVEVKPLSRMNKPLVLKKSAAGQVYAASHNMKFEIWTDQVINKIKKLLLTNNSA
jgi:hypothetical protein